MLLDTSRDKVLRQKKEENKYSIFRQNYQETTQDFIFILVEENFEIYKIDGLRNFPQKCLSINLHSKHKMASYMVRLFKF